MRRALLGVALTAALLAGCAQKPEAGSPTLPSEFDRRAEKVAQAWRDADIGDAFVPIGQLTEPPQEGFPDGDLKLAFIEGRYTLSTTLPTEAGKGMIRYADGKTAEVPLISADAAYRAIDKADASPTLEVTGAKPGTASILTTRGHAEVPVWLFTIKGVKHPVVQVAVAPEAIKQLPAPPAFPQEPPDPSGHLVSAQDLTVAAGNKIDYRLGVGACDKGVVAVVWESDDIIVIGGKVTEPPAADMACTAQLLLHPVSVTLKAPVGTRVILDIQGTPPPVQPQPA